MSVSMKKIVSVILSIALVLTYSMSSISLIKAEEVIVPEYEIYVKGQDEKVKLELEMLYKKSGSDEERKEAKAKLKEQLKNIDESKYDWDNIEEENGSKYDVDFYSGKDGFSDRKSTRLNSSHANISYAVFCLKKKKNNHKPKCDFIATYSQW